MTNIVKFSFGLINLHGQLTVITIWQNYNWEPQYFRLVDNYCTQNLSMYYYQQCPSIMRWNFGQVDHAMQVT